MNYIVLECAPPAIVDDVMLCRPLSHNAQYFSSPNDNVNFLLDLICIQNCRTVTCYQNLANVLSQSGFTWVS